MHAVLLESKLKYQTVNQIKNKYTFIRLNSFHKIVPRIKIGFKLGIEIASQSKINFNYPELN
jgi:hypothetical protein